MTMVLGTSGSSAVLGQSESRQQLRRAEEVARLVSSRRDLYEDTEAWASHQELTTLYVWRVDPILRMQRSLHDAT